MARQKRAFLLNREYKKGMKAYLYVLLMGVGIGILIAPDKGSNTRRKIMKAMDDLLEEGEEALDIDAPKMEPLKY